MFVGSGRNNKYFHSIRITFDNNFISNIIEFVYRGGVMGIIILGPTGLSILDYFMYSLFFLAVFTIIFIVGYMVGKYGREV